MFSTQFWFPCKYKSKSRVSLLLNMMIGPVGLCSQSFWCLITFIRFPLTDKMTMDALYSHPLALTSILRCVNKNLSGIRRSLWSINDIQNIYLSVLLAQWRILVFQSEKWNTIYCPWTFFSQNNYINNLWQGTHQPEYQGWWAVFFHYNLPLNDHYHIREK